MQEIKVSYFNLFYPIIVSIGVRLYFDLFDQDDVSDSESCDSDSDYDYVLVQINGETILYINLETFEERVYFRGRYLSPSETFITWIDILEPVDHFISEVFNEDSALIPPCLFVAAVFHIIGKEHTKDSEKLKKVLEKFTEGPSLGPIPENNLGAIWQCAHPITALLEYAKYSNDFSFIADWSDLSEEVIDKLADEISRSKFHKFVLSPETFECDKILRAVASNWRITTVCFEGYCPEYGDEFYGEQFPVLDSLVGQETGYADIDELIEKVFDIWSETETLHQRTIRYDSLHAIKPINIPINCVIPSCILSVNSSEPLDSHPYPLTIEIGKGREMVASNTRYLKRLGMLRNAYYFITGKRLEDDFPITLPVQDSLKLCHLFLINSSHEPIQDCCLDLIPWDVWLLIIEELDPKDFEKLALSNTSLGALVTALVLHWFIKEPNYPYDRSVRAVLEKWRYVIQKHKQKFGSFAYHKYTEEFGVKLHVDLRSVGYDCGYQDVEKKYRAFLYNNTQL